MKTLSRLILTIVVMANMLVAQQTTNVFIAVIDGVRYSETFGDSSHQYIQRIWNNLRPIGTTYTSFYNNGLTETNPGHSTIVTGAWQYIPNNGTVRPHQPTVFEYFRKEKLAAINECFVILGKDKLNILAYSDNNEYSYPYRAVVKYSTAQYDDRVTFSNFRNVVVTSKPRLGIINFAGTDHAGHSGDWLSYVNALKIADSLIYEVWRTLQSDPFYRGKTTLIITGDHGRHLDYVADGFKSHGDSCEGCRHITTMIIGPDTPEGIVDTTKRFQIDIAPTIGKMLNFETKYSIGKAMPSAFITGVKSVGEILPQKIELMQNYPNPYDPSTILGEKIARLIEGITLPGAYELKLNPGEYSSGVYLCQLMTERSVIVNYMVLGK
jgi:Metalloenzyme superfamily